MALSFQNIIINKMHVHNTINKYINVVHIDILQVLFDKMVHYCKKTIYVKYSRVTYGTQGLNITNLVFFLS